MSVITQPSNHKSFIGWPSGRTVLAALAVIAVVWSALAIQAAILSQRQDDSEARLNAQIAHIEKQIAPGAPATAGAAPAAASNAALSVPLVSTIDLKATDNKFSQVQFAVAVGKPATITFTNGGAAIHDLHIVGLAGADGQDVKTQLVDPGKSATLSFTPAQAGTYKFRCDVHPAEMTGTLIVR